MKIHTGITLNRSSESGKIYIFEKVVLVAFQKIQNNFHRPTSFEEIASNVVCGVVSGIEFDSTTQVVTYYLV